MRASRTGTAFRSLPSVSAPTPDTGVVMLSCSEAAANTGLPFHQPLGFSNLLTAQLCSGEDCFPRVYKLYSFNFSLAQPISFMKHNTTRARVRVKEREKSASTTLNRHLLHCSADQLQAQGWLMPSSATGASSREFKPDSITSHSSASHPAHHAGGTG